MADSALGYNGPPQVQAKDLNAGPMGGDQGVIPGSISSETIRFKIEAVTAEEWTRLQETGVDQDDSSIMRQMTNAATSAVAGMAAGDCFVLCAHCWRVALFNNTTRLLT